MFSQHGHPPMGILLVLRNLGPRHPLPVPRLSIPDTDDVSCVSPFHLSQFRFRHLTFAQHGKTDPNVSSHSAWCSTHARAPLNSQITA